MQTVLVQMTALIACGVLWRHIKPADMDAGTVRRVLTDLVYTLLLPALVLLVLWRAPLDWDALRIAVTAASGVLAALAVSSLIYRTWRTPKPSAGALILAATFPNVTYLGLPVLESTFGPWARSVAIQYDLFACTPLLLTAGILLAQSYGARDERRRGGVIAGLLKVPPLWAALIAISLNLGGVALPPALEQGLQLLANGVAPLMLIALGMALSWDAHSARRLPLVVPALLVQLALMPLVAWTVATLTGLGGERLTATVLEAAMPSMVLGVVLCDRYGLDTGLYAVTVTLSTALSLITLPLWYHILS